MRKTFFTYLVTMSTILFISTLVNAQSIQTQSIGKRSNLLNQEIRKADLEGKTDLKLQFLGRAQALKKEVEDSIAIYRRKTSRTIQDEKKLSYFNSQLENCNHRIYKLTTVQDLLNEPRTKVVADSLRAIYKAYSTTKATRLANAIIDRYQDELVSEAAKKYANTPEYKSKIDHVLKTIRALYYIPRKDTKRSFVIGQP